MPDHLTPEPESRGDLVPPPRVPPTALAATPAPDPDEGQRSTALVTGAGSVSLAPARRWRRTTAARMIDMALDSLDLAGVTIAEAIGLR